MRWDRIIEDKIRQAQEEGKFDNLPGAGQPLHLDNADEASEWWTAHHLLKTSGFRPDWVEDDAAVREQLQQLRLGLARTRDWRLAELQAAAGREDTASIHRRLAAEKEWDRARQAFAEGLTKINQAIGNLNLKVPLDRLQRPRLSLEAELRRLEKI